MMEVTPLALFFIAYFQSLWLYGSATCGHGRVCLAFNRLANQQFHHFENDLQHVTSLNHHLTNCSLGNDCPAFNRLLQGIISKPDVAHFVTQKHPWRQRFDNTSHCVLNQLSLTAWNMFSDTVDDRRRLQLNFDVKDLFWRYCEVGFITWRWFGVSWPSNYFRRMSVHDLMQELNRNQLMFEVKKCFETPIYFQSVWCKVNTSNTFFKTTHDFLPTSH